MRPYVLPIALSVLAVLSVRTPILAQDATLVAEDLTTIRNYVEVHELLTSAGQIGYDQIPYLADEGYEAVINLAPAREDVNALEGFHVVSQGLDYFHIPVDWEAPAIADLETFFKVLRANDGRKVFVHCFANMRASAFVFMYRTLIEGVPEEDARPAMAKVWDPAEVEQWGALIKRAQVTHGRQ